MISLTSTLTKIKERSFSYASAIEEIVLPNGLEIIIWEDKNQLDSCKTLTIDNVPETVNVGDTFTLNAKLDLMLGAMLNWSSDNENVAVIEENGFATVLGEGEATILCKTPDEKYSCSVTINAVSDSLDPYAYMDLDKEIVGTPFTSMQFPCEKLGGIIVLQDTAV